MQAANMNTPFWILIGILMLVGYLLAPHAIWHLCSATHAGEHDDEAGPGHQALHVFHQRKGG
jgi:hypothetical protein